jgi:hypothetical protein
MIASYIRSRGSKLQFDYHWVRTPAEADSSPGILLYEPIAQALRSERIIGAVGFLHGESVLIVHGVRSENRYDAIGRSVIDSCVMRGEIELLGYFHAWALQVGDPRRLLPFEKFIEFTAEGDFTVAPAWMEYVERTLPRRASSPFLELAPYASGVVWAATEDRAFDFAASPEHWNVLVKIYSSKRSQA